MLSITGVADCCRPNCQGEGWPSPAIAAPAPTRAKSAQTMIANAAERLRTGILRIAPSNDGAPRADSVALQDAEGSYRAAGAGSARGCRRRSAKYMSIKFMFIVQRYRATVRQDVGRCRRDFACHVLAAMEIFLSLEEGLQTHYVERSIAA